MSERNRGKIGKIKISELSHSQYRHCILRTFKGFYLNKKHLKASRKYNVLIKKPDVFLKVAGTKLSSRAKLR